MILFAIGVLAFAVGAVMFTIGVWLNALSNALLGKFVSAGVWMCVGIFMINAERGTEWRRMARRDAGVCRRDDRGCDGNDCEILAEGEAHHSDDRNRLMQRRKRRAPYPND